MNYKNYNPDDLVIDKPEQPLLQYAKNYLTKKYIDAMLKPDNKPKDIQKLINSVKDDKFKRAAINLTNNAKFIEITRNNPGNYYSLMKDYEIAVKEQKKIRDGKKTILDAKNLLIGIENNDYAAYIKAPNGNGNPAGQEDAGYTRLTEIVFAQILVTKGYNHIAYSNMLGEKGIKAAKKSMTEHFKELKILETLNDKELNKKLRTGAIKNYTLDISVKGMDKNTAFGKYLGASAIEKATKALKPEDGAGKNAENNEIKRRNSMVMKGENKGKLKGRNRSDSFSKK